MRRKIIRIRKFDKEGTAKFKILIILPLIQKFKKGFCFMYQPWIYVSAVSGGIPQVVEK